MLACRKSIARRRIRNNNSALCRRLHLDIVHARTRTSDELQFVRGFDYFSRNLRSAAYQKTVVVSDNLYKFVLGETRFHIDVAKGAKNLNTLFREGVTD